MEKYINETTIRAAVIGLIVFAGLYVFSLIVGSLFSATTASTSQFDRAEAIVSSAYTK